MGRDPGEARFGRGHQLLVLRREHLPDDLHAAAGDLEITRTDHLREGVDCGPPRLHEAAAGRLPPGKLRRTELIDQQGDLTG